jgi:hypothetical protein
MAFLLIIASWLVIVSLVVGACLAARRGDRQLERGTSARAPGDSGERLSPLPQIRSARAPSPSRAGALATLMHSSLPAGKPASPRSRAPSHDLRRHRATSL